MPSPDDRWPWEDESTSPPRLSYNQRISSTRPSGSSSFPRRSEADGGPGRHQQQQQPQQQQNSVSTEAFVHEMLIAHNSRRAAHQAPPLTLDKDLTRGAQAWAEMLANQDRLEPDMDSKTAHIGENLAMKYNSERTDFSGSEFTDYWYSGIVDFDFPEQSPKLQRGSAVLSFTQVVWKATRTAGFGRAVSRRGKVFVVGRYYPGGNSVEGFAENVLPSTEDRSDRIPRRSRMSGMPAAGSRIGEYPGMSGMPGGSRLSEYPQAQTQPVIGAVKTVDSLVSTNKSTVFDNDKTIVTIEEKYVSQDGSTYTRQRKTTYFGEYRNDN